MAGARPTERLPLRELDQMSVYWLGINAIWGGVGIFVQERVDRWRRRARRALLLALMGWIAVLVVLCRPADRRHDQ